MKVFLVQKRNGVSATGEYDIESGSLTVKKGSVLSATISSSAKFRGAETIRKNREGITEGTKLIKDITFKSPSTAANFVTGSSTNGLIAWKDKNGSTIKKIASENEVK